MPSATMTKDTQSTLPWRQRRLITYDRMPEWAHDNEFIRTGYRAPGGTKAQQEENVRNGNGATLALSSSVNGSSGVKRRNKDGSSTNGHTPIAEIDHIEEHDSYKRCWESVWLYAHNETVNIHTHLWGAIIAVAAVGIHVLGAFNKIPSWLHPITHHRIFYPTSINPIQPSTAVKSSLWTTLLRGGREQSGASLSNVPLSLEALFSLPTNPNHLALQSTLSSLSSSSKLVTFRPNDLTDWLGFASFLFGAVTVLSCSATFHTLGCHSRNVAKAYNKLDYIGIVAMIVGSFLPILHYGFYCHSHLQATYASFIITLGAAATYTVLSPKYTSPTYRPVRTSVFLALGLSAFIPVAHILQMYGYQAVSRTMGLDYLATGGALYVIGACMYMARIPERFSPGTFDYFGASHQIFHTLILLAAFSHYVCVRRSYVFWHLVQAIPSSSSYDKHQGATQAVCAAFELLRYAPSS